MVARRALLAVVAALTLAACEPADRLERSPADLDGTTPPNEVVRVHVRAIAHGDLTGAYSLVSRDYRAEVSRDAFDRQALPYKDSNAEIGSAVPDVAFPDAREVLVTLKRSDGSRVQVLYVLVREDGRWRIRGQEARPAPP